MKKFFGKIADKIRGLIDRYKNLGYRAKKKIKFVIGRIFLYFVLIELAYLFLLPFIYIFTTSMMSFQDYMDPTVKWIPTSIYWKNYSDAFKGLSYFGMFKGETGEKVFMSSFLNTCITSFGSAILQSVSCAIIGYALGRFKFKGRNIVFLTVILALLIPPQTMIIATYGIWSKLGMINTFMPVLLPTLFGLGIRGGLFALIYMYFFQRIPDAMDDAARIDGAGPFRVFLQIMLPLVRSAIAIVFIFSFVWHWNDNYEAPMYMYKDKMMTLQPKLQNIRQYFADLVGDSAGDSPISRAMTEPTLFAGCLLVLLPVLIVFIVGQKKLAAGIERIGVIE